MSFALMANQYIEWAEQRRFIEKLATRNKREWFLW